MARIYTHRDLTGLRFGKWLVLRENPERYVGKNGRPLIAWLCRCDRGTERSVVSGRLTSEHSESCGCEREIRRLKVISRPAEHVALTVQFLKYKRSALERGYMWELTKEDASDIVFSPCHYCGLPPSNIKKNSKGNKIEAAVNGIDRVDNSLGYKKENVVPCCSPCNKAKGSYTHEEFMSWVSRITAFQIKQTAAPGM